MGLKKCQNSRTTMPKTFPIIPKTFLFGIGTYPWPFLFSLLEAARPWPVPLRVHRPASKIRSRSPAVGLGLQADISRMHAPMPRNPGAFLSSSFPARRAAMRAYL
jgi:hypothetical protein